MMNICQYISLYNVLNGSIAQYDTVEMNFVLFMLTYVGRWRKADLLQQVTNITRYLRNVLKEKRSGGDQHIRVKCWEKRWNELEGIFFSF